MQSQLEAQGKSCSERRALCEGVAVETLRTCGGCFMLYYQTEIHVWEAKCVSERQGFPDLPTEVRDGVTVIMIVFFIPFLNATYFAQRCLNKTLQTT